VLWKYLQCPFFERKSTLLLASGSDHSAFYWRAYGSLQKGRVSMLRKALCDLVAGEECFDELLMKSLEG